MSDLIDRIDDVTAAVCADCGAQLDPDGPSPDFCDDDCQRRWTAHTHDVQRLVGYREPANVYPGYDAARWRDPTRPDVTESHEDVLGELTGGWGALQQLMAAAIPTFPVESGPVEFRRDDIASMARAWDATVLRHAAGIVGGDPPDPPAPPLHGPRAVDVTAGPVTVTPPAPTAVLGMPVHVDPSLPPGTVRIDHDPASVTVHDLGLLRAAVGRAPDGRTGVVTWLDEPPPTPPAPAVPLPAWATDPPIVHNGRIVWDPAGRAGRTAAHWQAVAAEVMARHRANAEAVTQALGLVAPAFTRLAESLRGLGRVAVDAGLIPDPPPDDPMARALHARRNRNTGPAVHADPRRNRRRSR